MSALDSALGTGQTRDDIALSLMQMWGMDPNTVSPDLFSAIAPTSARSSYPYNLLGGNGAPGMMGLNDMGAPTNAPDVGLVSSTPSSPGIPGSGNILGDPGAVNDALGTVVSPSFSPDPNTGPPTGYFDSSIANTTAANNPNAPPSTFNDRNADFNTPTSTPTTPAMTLQQAEENATLDFNAPTNNPAVTITVSQPDNPANNPGYGWGYNSPDVGYGYGDVGLGYGGATGDGTSGSTAASDAAGVGTTGNSTGISGGPGGTGEGGANTGEGGAGGGGGGAGK